MTARFWSRPTVATRSDVDPSKLIYTSRWFELKAVSNVREVLAWAEENAAGRLYVVYAAVRRGDDAGLVRVFGIDPTKHKDDRKLDWPGQVYLDE